MKAIKKQNIDAINEMYQVVHIDIANDPVNSAGMDINLSN